KSIARCADARRIQFWENGGMRCVMKRTRTCPSDDLPCRRRCGTSCRFPVDVCDGCGLALFLMGVAPTQVFVISGYVLFAATWYTVGVLIASSWRTCCLSVSLPWVLPPSTRCGRSALFSRRMHGEC